MTCLQLYSTPSCHQHEMFNLIDSIQTNYINTEQQTTSFINLDQTEKTSFSKNDENSVEFVFKFQFDRIRTSWIEEHKLPFNYQLRLFLLNNTDDLKQSNQKSSEWIHKGKKSKEDHHRHQGKLLTINPIASKKIQIFQNENDDFFGTEIHFDQQDVQFSCKLYLNNQKKQIQSQVVRIKLEQCFAKGLSTIQKFVHTEPVGFFDIDLACHLIDVYENDYQFPMVLFSEYNKHIVNLTNRHQRYLKQKENFSFDIWLHMESIPMVKASNIDLNDIYGLCRRDSLPNLSDDKELKYKDPPPLNIYKHLLNLFGLLPPGQLFRVSIHFGQIEHLENFHDKHKSVCACFEVKHPTLLPHNRQSTICCRTKHIQDWTYSENSCGQFDQYFTFFEQFYNNDSPDTCLSIMTEHGKKLYKYKCHLVDYVNCRSVNQFFYLQGKHEAYCRLQFSIAVKPIN